MPSVFVYHAKVPPMAGTKAGLILIHEKKFDTMLVLKKMKSVASSVG